MRSRAHRALDDDPIREPYTDDGTYFLALTLHQVAVLANPMSQGSARDASAAEFSSAIVLPGRIIAIAQSAARRTASYICF